MLGDGYTFTKKVVKEFDTHEEAATHEIALQKAHNVDMSEEFLNVYVNRSEKFGLSTEQRTKIQKQLIQEGRHNFLDPEHYVKIQAKMRKEGTHNFLGGKIGGDTQRRLVAEGKHLFQSGEIQRKNSKALLEIGKHPFQNQRFFIDLETGRVAKKNVFGRYYKDRMPFTVPL
jgi:hypothetical protein